MFGIVTSYLLIWKFTKVRSKVERFVTRCFLKGKKSQKAFEKWTGAVSVTMSLWIAGGGEGAAVKGCIRCIRVLLKINFSDCVFIDFFFLYNSLFKCHWINKKMSIFKVFQYFPAVPHSHYMCTRLERLEILTLYKMTSRNNPKFWISPIGDQ